ncbi:MAG: single-stranded DNA-binding protein [Bifidobacteriaceae bacterium]|jgi:single-strand DNA-binding protein|nr:single-stranded DNA-binding protein [Bifidobacteriaceae bacterium]
MAGDTVITVVGNLAGDPELRFTANGAVPVANFTVASTPRVFDRATSEWQDGQALFMRCSVWRDAAENVAETLRKGMRVIVQGRLTQRSYDTREGERRTVVELQVDEVGPSLRYASAQVTRNPRGGGHGGGGYGGGPDAGYGGGPGDGWGGPPSGGPGGPGGPAGPGGSGDGGYRRGGSGGYGDGGRGANYPAPAEDAWTAPGVTGNADDDPPF